MRFLRLALASVLVSVPVGAQTLVTITPLTATVPLGTGFQFTATVTGNVNTNFGWRLTLPAGATGGTGTITTKGRYTAPASLPSVNTVIVTAFSESDPTITAKAAVTLINPTPTLASTSPASVAVGPFTLTLNGTGFVNGAQAIFGATPLATTYVSATRLTVTGTAAGIAAGSHVPIVVTNPNPGTSTSVDAVSVQVGSTDGPPVIPANVAARFLDQAAFGPDPDTLAHVQSIGLQGYITEQLGVPLSTYPAGIASVPLSQVQARFFVNAVHGRDQLRQRVAFALSQLFVASAVEENTAVQLVPYHQILQKDAFANFRTLMEDVTLSPTMGEYLDMRNNDKANAVTGTRANENYARELMQLFTIGLFQLNNDGTYKLDGSGNPIATYDQTTIQNFAKVYTGWTYPTKPGANPQKHNPAYYAGPMVAYEPNHDATSKTLLNGLAVPAGNTAGQDLKIALDDIFNHPNVGPFVGKQLIQHLVTSNPSTQYVSRVAAKFNDNGAGVRGDMAAVITQILLDPEARQDDNGPQSPGDTSGHLREPAILLPAILRGIGAMVNDNNNLNSMTTNLGQTIFAPPTVFNYFPPGYTIPAEFTGGQNLVGPEFDLHSPSNAVARYNTLNSVLYGNLGSGAVIDLSSYTAVAANPQAVADLINSRYFHGAMPATINTELLRAMNGVTGTTAAALQSRAQAGLYVALTSSYYTVEH